VPIMLVSVRAGRLGAVDWGALQAGVILSILPCVLIYILLPEVLRRGLPERRREVGQQGHERTRPIPSITPAPAAMARRSRDVARLAGVSLGTASKALDRGRAVAAGKHAKR